MWAVEPEGLDREAWAGDVRCVSAGESYQIVLVAERRVNLPAVLDAVRRVSELHYFGATFDPTFDPTHRNIVPRCAYLYHLSC